MRRQTVRRETRAVRLLQRFVLVSLGLSLGLVSTACEDSEEGGAAPEAETRVRPKRPKAEKKPEVTSEAAEADRLAYAYNPIGKRDPFRSFIAKDPVVPEGPAETPLQKYEIDQYKLVGIIWGNESPVAMVEDPEGMGFFLQKDTLIGRNWGKVVRISPNEVIVAEEYRDFEGKLIVNEIPLKMPVDEKE